MAGSERVDKVAWMSTAVVFLIFLLAVLWKGYRPQNELPQETVSHAARALNAPPGQSGIRIPPRRVLPLVVNTADTRPLVTPVPDAAAGLMPFAFHELRAPLRVSDVLFTKETHESQSVPLTYSDGPFWLRGVVRYEEGEFCDAVDALGRRHLIRAGEIDWRRTTDRPLVHLEVK